MKNMILATIVLLLLFGCDSDENTTPDIDPNTTVDVPRIDQDIRNTQDPEDLDDVNASIEVDGDER